MLAHGADLGLAHDGDADRCLAIDAAGEVVDGDAIMVILALAMQETGELADNTLVATVMSNLGLHLAMRAAGVTVRTTGVGDRYVLEELRSGDYSLGGEQSGHIVLPALGHHRRRHSHRPAADVANGADRCIAGRPGLRDAHLAAGADQRRGRRQGRRRRRARGSHRGSAGRRRARRHGRILLRPSGTEQMIRVMVEADDERIAHRLATHVAETVRAQH